MKQKILLSFVINYKNFGTFGVNHNGGIELYFNWNEVN
jgi:hypothetical protein